LASQETELRAAAVGEVVAVFRDRASGLSVKRSGLRRLLDGAARREFDVVRVTHEDRLARFGVEWLSMLLEVHGVQLLVLHQREESSPHNELLGDFVSLVASFSGRLYGQRSVQARARLLREAA
jgi:predicted site-specific integrase-resolvase